MPGITVTWDSFAKLEVLSAPIAGSYTVAVESVYVDTSGNKYHVRGTGSVPATSLQSHWTDITDANLALYGLTL